MHDLAGGEVNAPSWCEPRSRHPHPDGRQRGGLRGACCRRDEGAAELRRHVLDAVAGGGEQRAAGHGRSDTRQPWRTPWPAGPASAAGSRVGGAWSTARARSTSLPSRRSRRLVATTRPAPRCASMPAMTADRWRPPAAARRNAPHFARRGVAAHRRDHHVAPRYCAQDPTTSRRGRGAGLVADERAIGVAVVNTMASKRCACAHARACAMSWRAHGLGVDRNESMARPSDRTSAPS